MLRLANRWLALSIALVYLGVRESYRSCLALLGRKSAATPVVLTYHTVRDEELAGFESQMKGLSERAKPVFADDLASSNGRRAVAVTFDDAFQSTFDSALPILAKYRVPATIFVPTGFLGTNPGWKVTEGTSNVPSGRIVSQDVLESVDARLVRLGSHSVTHARLAAIAPTDLQSELGESKRTLERIVGNPVTMLSLPYGSFNTQVLTAAGRAGYEQVFANVPVERATPSLLVGRVNVSPSDWPIEFTLKAQGAYDWLVVAIPLKQSLMKVLRG